MTGVDCVFGSVVLRVCDVRLEMCLLLSYVLLVACVVGSVVVNRVVARRCVVGCRFVRCWR